MPKTEEMIHKQALDSAWSLLKFYSGSYDPTGHRVLADEKRKDYDYLESSIAESPEFPAYERELQQDRYNERRSMLEENPDLKERRSRRYDDGRSHKDTYLSGKMRPDSNSEDRVSTRDKVKDPEMAEGESSFRTEGTGDSVMEPMPDWLRNEGNDASQDHPMYRGDNSQSLMATDGPSNMRQDNRGMMQRQMPPESLI